MSISLIRKPRYHISRKKRRFVGFKVGDIVWYNFRGSKRYIITSIDDCYDWAYKGPFIQGKRQTYSIYFWTKPFSKNVPTNIIARKTWLKQGNVMQYNKSMWQSGHIGHSLSYYEVFHTKGEAQWNYISRK